MVLVLLAALTSASPLAAEPTLPKDSIPADAPEKVRKLIEQLYSDVHHERSQAVNGLRTMGKAAAAAVPFLSAMLADNDGDGDYPHYNIYCAGSMAAVALPDIDPSAMDVLLEALDSKNRWVRRNAVVGIVKHREERALPRLRTFLESKDPSVRRLGTYALGRMRDRKSSEALLRMLRDDDNGVRGEAAGACARLNLKKAVPGIIAMAKDPKGSLRAQATWALGVLRDPATTDTLIGLLKDELSHIRIHAVSVLGKMKARQAVPVLCEMLKSEDSSERYYAAKALGEIGDPKAAPALQDLLRDPMRNVQIQARKALDRIGFLQEGEQARAEPPAWHHRRGRPEEIKPEKIDAVRDRVKDPFARGVEWIVYEKKFVARQENDRIRNFEEFLSTRGIDEIKVNKLAFTKEAAWAATDRGAFCYERRSRGWVEYAVNREHIGLPVDSVEAGTDGSVTFRMKIEGKALSYTLDTKSSTWK